MLKRIWALFKLARPYFLLGSGIIYLIGALMAWNETHQLNFGALALGLVSMWLVQLATHFLNEYYDQAGDRLNKNRTPFSGGSGVLLTGQLKAEVALWAGWGSLTLSVCMLLVLAQLPTFGVATVALLLLAALGAAGYSTPPVAFANRGLGELDVTLTLALLVPLFGYNLQTGKLSLSLALTLLPFAALVCANMLAIAFPDYQADRETGKRTLVVILGQERAAQLYSGLLVTGYVAPWLTLGWGLPFTVLLAEAATLPVAVFSLRELWHGGYREPDRFGRNTFLGVGTLVAVALSEVIGFLLVGLRT